MDRGADQSLIRKGGGGKIPDILLTSFMDDPQGRFIRLHSRGREGLWLSYSLLLSVRRGLMDGRGGKPKGNEEGGELLRTNKIGSERPNITHKAFSAKSHVSHLDPHCKLYFRKCSTELECAASP